MRRMKMMCGRTMVATALLLSAGTAVAQTVDRDRVGVVEPERDMGMGWIGLLGLAGLAGLMRRDPSKRVVGTTASRPV